MPMMVELSGPKAGEWRNLGVVPPGGEQGSLRDIGDDGKVTYILLECADDDSGGLVMRVRDPDLLAEMDDRRVRILAFDTDHATVLAKIRSGGEFSLVIRNSSDLPPMTVRFRHDREVC